MIGTGFSDSPHSAAAGQAAAAEAVARTPGHPSLALAFIGGAHAPEAALCGIRAELGALPIVGGASIGAIVGHRVGYRGTEVAVATLPATLGTPAVVVEEDLKGRGEMAVGRSLGARLGDLGSAGDTVLLFYDSVRNGGGVPDLYSAAQIMDGLYEGLAGRPRKLFGAGALSDLNFGDSWLIANGRTLKHAVVAVALPSSIDSETRIFHGCRPISAFHQITRIEGSLLYELDGRPALEVLKRLVPPSLIDTDSELMLNVTIGHKIGPPFGPYDESWYVNRLILGALPEQGAVRLIDCDFSPGTRIQIMMRDPKQVLSSVIAGCTAILTELAGRQALGALYIDCAGRTNAISGLEQEEAELVSKAVAGTMPLAGFFSGVEIAPLQDRSRPLDWTGVLTVLVRNESPP